MIKRFLFAQFVIVLMLLTFQPITAQSSTPKITWTQVLSDPVSGIAISPNGKQVAFNNPQTNQITLIDWQTKNIAWKTEFDLSISGRLYWSPDGKYISILSGGSIYLLEATTGNHVSKIEKSLTGYEKLLQLLTDGAFGYTDLKWSADGKQLAVMAYGYVLVYDLNTDVPKTLIDLVNLESGDLHNYLYWFDWSPDGSKFAAFHYRADDETEGRLAVFPLDIVIGFWDNNGRWLYQYEKASASLTDEECVPHGEDLFRGFAVPPGINLVWSPDNTSVAVSGISYTVCTLAGANQLLVNKISDSVPSKIHWTADQKWLFGIMDCSMLITDITNNYGTRLEAFDEPCINSSLSWSLNDRYVALSEGDGIWIGTIEYP